MSKPDRERIVVTGMGALSPLGLTLPIFAQALLLGKSGISSWGAPKKNCQSVIGGDMSQFDFRKFLQSKLEFSAAHHKLALKLLRSTPLAGRLACLAALDAYYNADKPCDQQDKGRFGCVMAGQNFNADNVYENIVAHASSEGAYMEPLFGLIILDNDILAVISELLQIEGPGATIGNSYISSHHALLEAENLIQMDRADVVLVAAASQILDPLLLDCFISVGAMAAYPINGEPKQSSRPFDVKRQGFVPSHAGAALVLERLDHAKNRGAFIHAEWLGGATGTQSTQSFYPSVKHASRIMKNALYNAQVYPEQVDYINAHGDSSRLGDAVEVAALKNVFGKKTRSIPVNATKSMLGHSLTAAGLLECIATVLQIQQHTLHPTINLDEPSVGFDLNFVLQNSKDYSIRIGLSNSYGFYGAASSILIGRFRG